MNVIHECLAFHRLGWFRQMTAEQALTLHPEVENNPGGEDFYALYSPQPSSLFAHRGTTPEEALTDLAEDLVRSGMVRSFKELGA